MSKIVVLTFVSFLSFGFLQFGTKDESKEKNIEVSETNYLNLLYSTFMFNESLNALKFFTDHRNINILREEYYYSSECIVKWLGRNKEAILKEAYEKESFLRELNSLYKSPSYYNCINEFIKNKGKNLKREKEILV